jgi:hypothetical protein
VADTATSTKAGIAIASPGFEESENKDHSGEDKDSEQGHTLLRYRLASDDEKRFVGS